MDFKIPYRTCTPAVQRRLFWWWKVQTLIGPMKGSNLRECCDKVYTQSCCAHALFVCCHPSLPETTSLELPRLVEPYRLTVIYTRENSKEVHSGKVLLFWCALYTRTHSQTLLQCHTLSQKSDFWWRSHSLKTSPLYTFPPTSTAVLRGCVRIWLTKKFAYVHTFWV